MERDFKNVHGKLEFNDTFILLYKCFEIWSGHVAQGLGYSVDHLHPALKNLGVSSSSTLHSSLLLTCTPQGNSDGPISWNHATHVGYVD